MKLVTTKLYYHPERDLLSAFRKLASMAMDHQEFSMSPKEAKKLSREELDSIASFSTREFRQKGWVLIGDFKERWDPESEWGWL